MKKSLFNRNILRLFTLILSVIFSFTSCSVPILKTPDKKYSFSLKSEAETRQDIQQRIQQAIQAVNSNISVSISPEPYYNAGELSTNSQLFQNLKWMNPSDHGMDFLGDLVFKRVSASEIQIILNFSQSNSFLMYYVPEYSTVNILRSAEIQVISNLNNDEIKTDNKYSTNNFILKADSDEHVTYIRSVFGKDLGFKALSSRYFSQPEEGATTLSFELIKHKETDEYFEYLELVINLGYMSTKGEIDDAIKIEATMSPITFKSILVDKVEKTDDNDDVPTDPCSSGSGGGGGFSILRVDPCNPNPPTDCEESILPEDLINNTSSREAVSGAVSNLKSSFKDYRKADTKLKNAEEKLNNFVNKSFSLKQTKQELKLQELQQKVLESLNEKNQLLGELNNILSDGLDARHSLRTGIYNLKPDSPYIKDYINNNDIFPDNDKPFNLQGYKDKIESLHEEFTDFVNSENTHGLLEASGLYADEVELLRSLVEDYINGVIWAIPPAVDTGEDNTESAPLEDDKVIETPSRLSTLNTPQQVINYFINQIIQHNNKFNNKISQLQQEVESLKTKVVQDFSEHSVNIQKLDAKAESFSQFLDQLDIDADEPAFTTQSFRIKAQLTEEQARKLSEKLQKVREKRNKDYEQMKKDHPNLTGAGELVVDQFTNPINVIPLPGAGPLMGKAISQAGKFIGVNALALWMKIAEKKGFAYAMGKMDEFNLSLSQMAKDSLDAAKSFFKSQADVNDLSRICKSAKCSNSFKLGENIFDAPFDHLQKGLPKPRGWQSHHIVPENHSSPFAKKSRDLLEKYGIDYKTSAYNGVNLPKGKLGKNYDSDPNFPDVINHSETFKKEYPEKVLKRLEDSIDGKPEGYRKEILQNELKQMGEDILIGNKFW